MLSLLPPSSPNPLSSHSRSVDAPPTPEHLVTLINETPEQVTTSIPDWTISPNTESTRAIAEGTSCLLFKYVCSYPYSPNLGVTVSAFLPGGDVIPPTPFQVTTATSTPLKGVQPQ
jgi:hypothetical protein